MTKIFINDLGEGINELELEIPNEEIQTVNLEFYPDIIKVNLFIDKIENLLRIKFEIKTDAVYVCDRCLDEYKNKFHKNIEQLFQIGHSELDSDDDIKILPVNTKEIELNDVISEAFLIHRPIKLLCNNDCKGLCSKCGVNLNHKKCKCKSDLIDPRLEKLKAFLN